MDPGTNDDLDRQTFVLLMVFAIKHEIYDDQSEEREDEEEEEEIVLVDEDKLMYIDYLMENLFNFLLNCPNNN